jgi:hypothetical protein
MRNKFMLLGLLGLLFLPLAQADTFNFTFTPNQSQCYSGSCTDFGSGTFTTQPLTFNPIYNPASYPVESISGSLDGAFSMAMAPGVGAILGSGTAVNYNSGPINFFANGQEWGFLQLDQGPWRDFLYNYNTGTSEAINLTITAPEPAAFLLLAVGLLLMVASLFFAGTLLRVS